MIINASPDVVDTDPVVGMVAIRGWMRGVGGGRVARAGGSTGAERSPHPGVVGGGR